MDDNFVPLFCASTSSHHTARYVQRTNECTEGRPVHDIDAVRMSHSGTSAGHGTRRAIIKQLWWRTRHAFTMHRMQLVCTCVCVYDCWTGSPYLYLLTRSPEEAMQC